MQKTKSKNDSSFPMGRLPFIALWILGLAFVSQFARIVSSLGDFEGLMPQLSEVINKTAFVLRFILIGLLEVQLVERLLRRSMRGWMLYTIPGTLMNFLARGLVLPAAIVSVPTNIINILLTSSGVVVLDNLVAAEVQRTFFGIAANFPVTVFQALWLHRRVKRAWLWPVIAFFWLLSPRLISILFGSTGATINYSLIYGGLQGLLMYELWRHPKHTEKTKVDIAPEEQSERIHRLQDTSDADILRTGHPEEHVSQRSRL